MLLTGEVLRAARALARLEQAEFAELAGVSLETVKRLERVRGPIRAKARTVEVMLALLAERHITVEAHPDGGVALVWRGPGAPAAALRRPSNPPREDLGPVHRLIYHSRAAAPLAVGDQLEDILRASVARNGEFGVSGCLLAANGRFMQALEGDRRAVMLIYGLIASDPRHRDLMVMENRAADRRRFADWLMSARRATPAELARADPTQVDGFDPERLSPAGALSLLTWFSELERHALAEA
jgi:transcriptional regulator with XRE-family HTH domain